MLSYLAKFNMSNNYFLSSPFNSLAIRDEIEKCLSPPILNKPSVKIKFHCGFLHMHLNETVTVFLGDMQVKLEEDKGEVLFLSTT